MTFHRFIHRLAGVFLALILSASPLAADVEINFGGLDFRTNTNTQVPEGRLVLLLANVATATTSGVGFDTLAAGSLQLGSILNGTYQVIGRAPIDNGFGTSGSTGAITLGGIDFPNLSTGDQLAVAWFPTLDYSSSTPLQTGMSYGLYTVYGSPAWKVPADGTSNLSTLTVPPGSMATLTAIPEPSTYAALAGAAALGLGILRRRKIARTR